jgi:uncharacterized protein DUF4154
VLDRTLAGKTVGDRALAPRRLSSADGAGACDVLFVASRDDAEDAVRVGRSAPVLTIGESDDFVRRGGMIQFVTQGNRIRFAINLAAVEHAGLRISSEVLKLATDVQR